MLVGRLKATGALVALLGLAVLAALASTPAVTREDTRLDSLASLVRFHDATRAFVGLTAAAQEAVGLLALGIGVTVLVVRGLRWTALRLLAASGASWSLALVVKHLVGRPRPPARLWLVRPDSAVSFPSGHETTACVLVVITWLALTGVRLWLRAALTAAVAGFAVAVGLSRIYLGDHYPTDVLGSWITVTAAVLLTSAVLDLTPVRRLAARVLRTPEPLLAPRRGRHLGTSPAAAPRGGRAL